MTTSIHSVDKGRYSDPDGGQYIWAKATGSALANGDVVILDATNTTNALWAVKRTTTADDTTVVGVCLETVTSGSFGKIQVYGTHSAVKIDGTTTSVAIEDRIAAGTVTAKANLMKATTVVGGMLGTSLATVTTGSDSTYLVFIDPR